MSKNPKFMVFHLRELIYTFIFVILGIALIIMLIFMFNNQEERSAKNNKYTPGTYTSNINLSDANMELKVTVDENHINSITLNNMDDSIATMYPLIQPALEDIANQVIKNQSLENIQYEEGSMYTYTLLTQSIDNLLDTAME